MDCADRLEQQTFEDEEALIDHIKSFARRFGFAVSIGNSKYTLRVPRDPSSRFRDSEKMKKCCRWSRYRIIHANVSVFRVRDRQSSSEKGCHSA